MSNENQTSNQVDGQAQDAPKKRRRIFSRRNFLIGGAIVLGGSVATVYFGRNAIRREVHHMLATNDAAMVMIGNIDQPMAFFEMQPDNTLMLNAPYAEMGQGILTGFAMLAAEELDLRMDQIHVRPTPFDKVIDNGATGGSGTTRAMYRPMREIAATFREMLKMAAGKQWGVDPSTTPKTPKPLLYCFLF